MGLYAKAVTALLTAFGATFATASQDNNVTSNEWVAIVVGTLIAGLAVFTVPNARQSDDV